MLPVFVSAQDFLMHQWTTLPRTGHSRGCYRYLLFVRLPSAQGFLMHQWNTLPRTSRSRGWRNGIDGRRPAAPPRVPHDPALLIISEVAADLEDGTGGHVDLG